MTRKDFEIIAAIVHTTKVKGHDGATLAELVQSLGAYFETRNLAFDLDRFHTACGMPNGEWVI